MTKSGVTYYKLTQIYSGDVTKNCSLTGSEIDKNFHFLRGYDIESAHVDADNDAIVLTRLNSDDIIVQGFKEYIETKTQKKDIDTTGTYYDKETGILHLMLDNNESLIEGFYVPDNIFVGEGLKGNGSINNPIHIDNLYIPGLLKSAEAYIDITIGEELPVSPSKGDRYLTKESTTPYGLLYNFAAIKAINDKLKKIGSDWHVPSIEEWDKMLNAIELCDEDKNHTRHIGDPYNGKYAGLFLKGKRDWKTDDFVLKYHDFGFNILPAGIREGAQYVQFSRAAEFWSMSEDEYKNIHVKKFHGNKDTVQHRLENADNCYSLRLVRTSQRGFSEIELIDGKPYTCVCMPSINEDFSNGSNIWTSENISIDAFDTSKYPHAKAFKVVNAEGEVIKDSDVYFINEWNGIEWEKKIFEEGDIIVLKNYSGSTFEEVTLIEGILVPTNDKIKKYIDEEITSERNARIEKDSELDNKIAEEKSARIEKDSELNNKIAEEKSARIEKDSELDNKIAEEKSARIEKDNELDNKIAEERSTRIEKDNELDNKIAEERSTRIEKDNELKAEIENESNRRIETDIVLGYRIEIENKERKEEDSLIKETVKTKVNIEDYNAKVEELEEKIDSRVKGVKVDNVSVVDTEWIANIDLSKHATKTYVENAIEPISNSVKLLKDALGNTDLPSGSTITSIISYLLQANTITGDDIE